MSTPLGRSKTFAALAATCDRLNREYSELQELREAVAEAERSARALGRYPEILEVLALLERGRKPAGLLPATGPRLRGSRRIAILRKHRRIRTLRCRT